MITIYKLIVKSKQIYICLLLTFFFFQTFDVFAQWQGSGTAQNPYRIYTLSDLEAMTDNEISFNGYTNIYFDLMNDITDSLKHFLGSDFDGHFNGKGHFITLALNHEDHLQNFLFLTIYYNGTLDSLIVRGDVYNFVGMIGQNDGILSNITCELNIVPARIIENNPTVHYIDHCCVFANSNAFGKIKNCINKSNLKSIASSDTATYVLFSIFSSYNATSIDSCVNYGNIIIETNSMGNLYVSCLSLDNLVYGNANISNCKNYGDITITGLAETVSIGCFANVNDGIISNCINTGTITARKTDYSGIFACWNRYGKVLNCLNTGTLIGEDISGGIVGKMDPVDNYWGWSGIVKNCFNAGKIIGNTLVGGIIGSFSEPEGQYIIQNNLDISETSKYALFGDGSASSPATNQSITNNYYDKQMVTIPATPNNNVAGKAEGKLTIELTGDSPELQAMLGPDWSYAPGRYPIPLGLENDSVALLAATPMYLSYEDENNFNTVNNVKCHFKLGRENSTDWQVLGNKVELAYGQDENNLTIYHGILQNIGNEILIAELNNFTKTIPIYIPSVCSTISTHKVSGKITLNGEDLQGININSTNSDLNGEFSFNVIDGTNITLTPSSNIYCFIPTSRTINNIISDTANNNFTAHPIYTVSGTILSNDEPLENVAVFCINCITSNTTTNQDGYYEFKVCQDASIIIKPSLASYEFDPENIIITNITQDSSNNNFTATFITPSIYTVSGYVSTDSIYLENITINYGTSSTTTNETGYYEFEVLENTTITITPISTEYTFFPTSKLITNITQDTSNNNFTANTIGIKQKQSKNNEFQVYPNPANETLNFSSATSFEIIDIQGKVLLKSKKAVKFVNIKNLKSGVYFVKITENVYKFVKE